jgi:adenosine deaminase
MKKEEAIRRPEFIAAIPKTDLHLHLDGSLRIPTLIELAAERGVALPASDEAGLRRTVFKPSYANLDEYLKGFAYTCACLRDAPALKRVAKELMLDSAAEGVRYIEVRFAPQLAMSERLSFEEVVGAVDAGLREARDLLNAELASGEPEYDYGIIVCAMRFFTAGFSPWYADWMRLHAYSSPAEAIRGASLELAKAAVRARDSGLAQIVGFDLAGSEYGYPASEHAESYAYAHRHFLAKTVHAGEAYGPESIFQAVTRLHADRIGHGLHLFDAAMVKKQGEAARDPAAYVENLVEYLADRRVTIEVCLTSNMQTSPGLATLGEHSFGKMLARRLSVSLCTDNRLVSDTTVSAEYAKALSAFDIGPQTLKNIVMYGFKRSFNRKPYGEKRAWVRRVFDWYEGLEAKFGAG